ncbi:MAG: dTMP kinase [Betaproteobacteria bacterium RIFCSPLOWO2_02_FULL_67_26]|nr:MAG: dTMP kinase [Betaproteobacteria bacterium RIFCSPLOWO2_02_FULL_67_26]
MRGKFITLEGIDGAGKSTHLRWIARFLKGRRIKVTVTREPGGTAFGETLRRLLLGGRQRLHPETETLLVFAARREHLDKVIAPALGAGRWVLCDRFTDATYAYQSGGSRVRWGRVGALERWVQRGLQPDLTILFDVSLAVARRRAGRKIRPDRFERERDAYFERVRKAYLRRHREDPRRVRVIEAGRGMAEIRKELEPLLLKLCP